MASYAVRVHVLLRPGVLDPQGEAVKGGLHGLGFPGVRDVRVGKVFDLALDAETAEEARLKAEEMARRLLANPVLERFEIGGVEA